MSGFLSSSCEVAEVVDYCAECYCHGAFECGPHYGQTEDCVEVCEIQVLPEHQRRGLGTEILAGAIDHARQQGKGVILRSGLKNSGAHRLFRRLGFEETGRTDTHVHMRCSPRNG